jgi:hypothetical protein
MTKWRYSSTHLYRYFWVTCSGFFCRPITLLLERKKDPHAHRIKSWLGRTVGLDAVEKYKICNVRLKCDGTRAESIFRLSAKRTSPFKSSRASVQSTTGSRGLHISGTNAGYTMFRGSVKCTGYPLHSPVSPSLPFPCVTVCHHISTGLYICQV